MPELPEVETIRRGLAIRLEGRALRQVEQRRPDLRFPIPADFVRRVTGRRVLSVGRRAKYLLIHLDDGTVIICHLGMSGRLFIREGPPAPPARHDHVILHTDDGASITFADPRRFGLIDLAVAVDLMNHPRLAGLGLEPLGNEFAGAALAARLAGRRTPIKAALLNQTLVAGLGNIYVCEALFRAGLSPRRSAHTIAARRADRLVNMIKAVLEEAITAGGSSLRDYVRASGELGYFQHRFQVYGREGAACLAPGCAAAIRRIVQSGRSTFFCGACQR